MQDLLTVAERTREIPCCWRSTSRASTATPDRREKKEGPRAARGQAGRGAPPKKHTRGGRVFSTVPVLSRPATP
jgi:hypothetical protein